MTSKGSVIRQHRDTTHDGRFVARRPATTRRAKSRVLESAFEDNKPYELTELGSQFVHYAMSDLVPRLGENREPTPPPEPHGAYRRPATGRYLRRARERRTARGSSSRSRALRNS